MYNFWGFLLQTISVSIVAVIILLLKRIFEDKLSPRWQYSIWALLAIRIFVPVNVSKYVIPQIALWMEVFKENTEKMLNSNYSAVFEPITLHHFIPVITEAPQSITDWLFVIYVVGIVIFLLKYLTAYIRLRILLKRGQSVNSELEQKMLAVCVKYGLSPCKMVAIEGLSSAFICGVFRPVLVVPKKDEIDEKVLLHELLHLKHHDTIQNIGWCILRSLHWCNPLMHYIINHIENDMESLCDQRVLERLEGEERREYGSILLNMANQKYARIPGTTSISNGGNNIAKRIAAIVRFKKYPQGMALVSVCIILTLFWPTIIGTAGTYDEFDYIYYADTHDNSMTIARINRCGTVAGAIDMYAKGVYLMNGGYVATASSFSEHERIAAELEEYGCYQPGKYIGNIHQLYDYYVYNLDQRSEKEYTATLCYYADVNYNEYAPELENYVPDEDGNENCDAYIFIPISIKYEDAWVVEETAERYIIAVEEYIQQDSLILCGKEYYGKNDVGEVLLELETKYAVDNVIIPGTFVYWYNTEFDTSPKPNAVFNNMEFNKRMIYNHLSDVQPKSYVELKVGEEEWRLYEAITLEWDGSMKDHFGGGYGEAEVDITDLESSYEARLNIDGKEMDLFMIEEVAD